MGRCQWYGEKGGEGTCALAREPKEVDGCYERFGTDEKRCEAAAPRCQWYGEKGGKGKCALARESKKEDGCYERFGTDEKRCEAAAPRCQWYGEKGGKGKCALARQSKEEDGCYERFSTDEKRCEAAAPRCQWYGEKGSKGKCALPKGEHGTEIFTAAGTEAPLQVESNSEDETSAGQSPFSVLVMAFVSMAAGLLVIAGAGVVCLVRRRRAQKRDLNLASNVDQPSVEGNEVKLAQV